MEKIEFSDEQVILFANTVSDRVQHIKPSQETKKMFDELDKKFDKLGHSVDLHINDFKHFSEEMTRRFDEHQKIQEKTLEELQKSIETKAGKWVERAVSWSIYLIFTILITAITGLVIIK